MVEFHDASAHRRLNDLESRIEKGGGGPYDPGMESRIATIEATLPHLATKADVNDLRAEMHREFTAFTWKILTAGAAAYLTAVSGLAYLMARGFHWL